MANTVDPYQTPHNMASDLGLYCLRMTLLRVSRLEWVKKQNETEGKVGSCTGDHIILLQDQRKAEERKSTILTIETLIKYLNVGV